MKIIIKWRRHSPPPHLTAEHPVVDASGLVSAHGAHPAPAPAPALDFFFLHVCCVWVCKKARSSLSCCYLIKNQLGTDSCWRLFNWGNLEAASPPSYLTRLASKSVVWSRPRRGDPRLATPVSPARARPDLWRPPLWSPEAARAGGGCEVAPWPRPGLAPASPHHYFNYTPIISPMLTLFHIWFSSLNVGAAYCNM